MRCNALRGPAALQAWLTQAEFAGEVEMLAINASDSTRIRQGAFSCETHVAIEVRLYDIATGFLREKDCLGSQTLASNRTTELLDDLSVDQTTVIHALMLDDKDGRVIARASDWPQPLKHVNLPASPNVTVSVLDGKDRKVEIRADAPVKGLEVYVGGDERNVSWDDNGVDVFPDEVYTIYARARQG